jgi:hypothetical protein
MNDGKLALVYYNYRYYNPADGRWINRDPIAEVNKGDKNGLRFDLPIPHPEFPTLTSPLLQMSWHQYFVTILYLHQNAHAKIHQRFLILIRPRQSPYVLIF